MHDSRILCTGSTGFIGTPLTLQLETEGYDVYRFMRHFHPRYNPNNPKIIYGDITEPSACKLAVERSRPDIIIHLAAIALTDQYMYDHPNEVIHVIIDGTVNMGEAFHDYVAASGSFDKKRQPQFIVASTAEIYGHQDAKDRPFVESLEPHPCNFYSFSKYATELYLRKQFASYEIPYTIMRPSNTYGNLSYHRTFIDRCMWEMGAAARTLPFAKVRLGNPDAIRDWMFIDDHLAAYRAVFNNPKAYNETFNFCSGTAFTCRETAELIRLITNYKGAIEWKTGHPRPNDVLVLHGDPSKAKRVLNWAPEYTLKCGVEEYAKRLANL